MQVEELKRAVEDCRLLQWAPFHIKFDVYERHDLDMAFGAKRPWVQVRALFEIRDRQTGQNDWISRYHELTRQQVEMLDAGGAYRIVRMLAHDLLKHEFDEMFVAEGMRYFDPHANGPTPITPPAPKAEPAMKLLPITVGYTQAEADIIREIQEGKRSGGPLPDWLRIF